jgi:hypothetical protein
MKTFRALMARHADKVVEGFKDLDGYWVTLKEGWNRDGGRIVHEWSVRDLAAAFREVERD